MGREHALLFSKRGASVVLNDLSDEGVQTTKRMIEDAGGKAIAVQGSVGDQQVLQRIVDSAIGAHGRIDVLINNAGLEIKKHFDEFTPTELALVFDVHFFGSWNLTKLVWPFMQRQSYGKVIMVCSCSIYGMPQNAAYVSAKAALLGLAKSLAYEGRESNIYVNALAPVAFTNLARQMLTDESTWANAAENYPAWAVSPVCCWLAHEDCSLRGEIVSSWGRNFGKLFIGETLGIHVSGDYSIESVQDGWDKASSEEGYFTAKDVMEQNAILEQSRAGGSGQRNNATNGFE